MGSQKRGITIVESLIGLSILAFIIVFILLSVTLFQSSANLALSNTKATYLAEEGEEFARFIRDNNWATMSGLTSGTTYYFAPTASSIGVTTTPEVIGGTYTRSFTVQDTQRNGSGDFVESGGTANTGGKVVTVSVTWGAESVQFKSILVNINN